MDQKELEANLNRLESKVRMSLFEMEKRLIDLEHKEMMPSGQPVDVEDRLQYLEDIVMLIQIENEQLKEMIKSGHFSSDFSAAPDLEKRISDLENSAKPQEKENITFLTQEIANIDKRLQKLEDAIFHRAYKEPPRKKEEKKQEETNLFDEVNKILKGE